MGLKCVCVHVYVRMCTYVNADTCLLCHMCRSWRITLGVSPQFPEYFVQFACTLHAKYALLVGQLSLMMFYQNDSTRDMNKL